MIWHYIKTNPPTFMVDKRRMVKGEDDWWAALLQHAVTLDRDLRSIKERNGWKDVDGDLLAQQHSNIRIENTQVYGADAYEYVRKKNTQGHDTMVRVPKSQDPLINQAVDILEGELL